MALKHAHCARETYRFARTTETALHHIRVLRAVYAKTLTAKRDYHPMVTNVLKENIATHSLQNPHTRMCVERRRWYDQGKHDTRRQYADIEMSNLSYERCARVRRDTALLLTSHVQQTPCTWTQQERIIQLAQETAQNYRVKAAPYWEASKQARQTIHFIRKRPEEHWDPTLWEVPLPPLLKRQTAHWDSNEWEIALA